MPQQPPKNSEIANPVQGMCFNVWMRMEKMVKEDPIMYAIIWIGVLALPGFIIAVILSFALATPAGIIGRLFKRNKTNE